MARNTWEKEPTNRPPEVRGGGRLAGIGGERVGVTGGRGHRIESAIGGPEHDVELLPEFRRAAKK